MDELLKLWVKPEYAQMLVAVGLAVKFVAVPLLKTTISTSPNGTTSVVLAMISAVALAFLYKLMFMVGWSAQAVGSTFFTGILSGVGAIGVNVVVQAIKGKDVSIT
jgi:4-hydroxybenzoate polyprenyltransferase